jgi:pimeloyl-ACP methyl ester carboxylesterase
VLTKLGYLIDNPWSNALDRARAAGAVLADVLIERHLGVRPITLIGFSLGARLIFYCLLELAKKKAFGIVQDVFILGATLTASRQNWCQARSVVSGRFVNGYARNDWILNYLFRATSGGLSSIAGLRPVQDVPGLENVDVTDKITGHMSYRTFMPLILDQLGFPVSADYFDEPEVSKSVCTNHTQWHTTHNVAMSRMARSNACPASRRGSIAIWGD